ncbi:MAG: carboxypeptidase regulatory-like domain-containing protein [Microbacterium sp.]|uniref:MSCRAMM family protein n=1 Tax=Microbacterium sp. TaxID=51671 RepID=UPI001D89BE6C|nr:carboxypeptidase-like regulatory domain-containing protein [Microbacterium sp.]MBW8763227.1 carboxypeptidase regulatory-like domain-containing protein [Microbacterium sp.]
MRAHRGGILAGVIALVAIVVGVVPAAAATTTSWASWQPLSGSAGAYTSSVQIAAQPVLSATVTSDSRGGQVGVISGASTWLSEGTPVGAKYGSSINQSYVNLRPKADNATSPSTTTYSFASPTPASGWTFVLGDIDADSVRIHAVAGDGHVLDATELGFQGGFNYCAPGVAGKPSCTGVAADIPSWDPATLTLTGNQAAADTSGAAAWFEPSTPISSLTFFFTRRAGFPVYQTWFASIARDITGTVTDVVDGPLEGVELTLTDANGAVVGTTTTTAGGTYAFPGFVATDGYTVRVTPPDGKISESAVSQDVDLTDEDGVADFTVRDIVPVSVEGRVTDVDGNPIAGVTVTIDGRSTTTDADGRYIIDEVEVGEHTATITTPDGYTLVTSAPPFTVPEDSETPISGVDFVVAENPSLSGTVRSNGTGVAGVTVTASGPGGSMLSTVTDANGDYSFPRLPLGDYSVGIEVPGGYIASGPVARDESVGEADVEDVDFELARLGAIDGTVRTDGGTPAPGVAIMVEGPDGSHSLTTDADGAYGLGTLPPGTYTITVTAPSGSTIVGNATRTVVITAAGEVFGEQDFTLAAVVVAPTPTPTPTDPGTTGSTRLPATGLAPETFLWAGIGAVVLVIGGVLVVVSRRRSKDD